MSPWLQLAVGLIVLVGGADLLVRGAAGLARRFGIPPLVVGLTIVAFGTSSPEVAVSLAAARDGRDAIALGNAVGSNTFNVLFILGISALVRPLVVHRKLVRIDVPIMIGVSVLLWIMLLDGVLSRIDGLILFGGIVAYTAHAVRVARREAVSAAATPASGPAPPATGSTWWATLLVIAGLALAVLGARWFVDGAVVVAVRLGVSELVVGLTIVAAGTSMPEVATSLVAVFRGQRDLAVGNVIGSNIFNILAILGLVGLLAPSGAEAPAALLAIDLPVMIATAVACLPIVFTGHLIARWEGALLLAAWLAYVTWLVLDSSGHDALAGFNRFIVWFAMPIAAIGVAASVIGSLRRTPGG